MKIYTAWVLGLLFLLCAMPLKATTYFVANAGSDANNGTSSGTPWQTIAHVNAQTFAAGDIIQFNRGDIWRETLLPPSSGTIGSHITFQDYGSGAKPSIRGSNTYNSAGNWTNLTGNIWFASGLANDPAIFIHDGMIGARKTSQGALGTQWDYFYDSGNTRLDVYSVGNPTTVGTVLEIAVRKNILDNNSGKDYIDWKNLDVEDDYNGPEWWEFNAIHATFTNVDFKNSGGYIQQWQNGSQGSVTGSTFTNWGIGLINGGLNYALQVIGFGGTPSGPVDVTNNIFTFTLSNACTDCSAADMDDNGWIRTFTGNTVVDGGSVAGAGLLIFQPAATATTTTVQNNIFTNIGNECVEANNLEHYGPQNINISYNSCNNATIKDTLDVDAIRVQSFTGASTILVSYNVVNGCHAGSNGHGAFRVGTAAGTWRFIGNTANGCTEGLRVSSGVTGGVVENNNFTNNSAYGATVEGGSTITTFDYNLYFGNTTSNYNGISGGAHDVTGSDPKYTNAAGGNFTLLSGSPAINVGLNLGTAYQLGLNPASMWPGNVSTANQNAYGTGWEIGAFVFIFDTINGTFVGPGVTFGPGVTIQ